MESILQTLQEEFHSELSLREKNYFLFQTIRELLSEKIALEHILYLNFEDNKMLPMDHKTMGQLVDITSAAIY